MLALGPHRYDVTHRALVMGILSRTSDSFRDPGRLLDLGHCCRRAEQLVDDGADVLDVGGAGTGRETAASEAEELDCVVPAIEALHARFDVPLSCHTSRPAVARAAFAAGAVVGNGISAFTDPDYLAAAATAGASVVATHVGIAPGIGGRPHEGDVLAEVIRALVELAGRAEAAGVGRARILVDAGLDVGKTPEQSLVLLRGSPGLAALGYPVLLSVPDKAFSAALLGLEAHGPADDARVAAHALGVIGGCRVLRAHDARGARRVAEVLAAVLAAECR